MTLVKSKSKNATSLYVTKSMRINGVATTKVVEKLGSVADLREKLNGRDPIEWAEEYVAELTRLDKEGRREINIRCSPVHIINKDEQRLYSGGYIFFQRIYHDLGIDKISKKIVEKRKLEFNLDSIFSRLIYSRLLFPDSKLSTYDLSKKFFEQPRFESHHVTQAIEVIGEESDYIQAELYKRSAKVIERRNDTLYFDFTNHFFEIEQEDLRQNGYKNEYRKNPIVGMGLFMDEDGLPLAFSIQDDNIDEQATLKPLGKKILSEFKHSKFVVCTNSGVSSAESERFIDSDGRGLITTQSMKNLKKRHREWALDSKGWCLLSENSSGRKLYDISKIDEEAHKESTFYKEQWIDEDKLEQRLIVTYSIKYKDVNKIAFEEAFEGFYAVCTNLEDDVASIIRVNNRRLEIEEFFRKMKCEFKAKPDYAKRDMRMKAHFATCFASLLIYRILEKRLNDEYTYPQIIKELRDMYFLDIPREGFIPAYVRTDFTDALHDAFGFRTDYRILTLNYMKNIYKLSKK